MNPAYLAQLVNHRVVFDMIGRYLGPVVVNAITNDGYVEYTTFIPDGINGANQPVLTKATGRVMASALIGYMDLGEPTMRG